MLRHIEPHERNNLDTGEGILWRITLRSRDSITIFFSYSSQATYKIMVNNSKLFDCICFRKARMDARRTWLSITIICICGLCARVCVCLHKRKICKKEMYTRVRNEEEKEKGKKVKRKRKKERKMREIILEGMRWASQVPMGALVCLEEASWSRLNSEFRQAARSSWCSLDPSHRSNPHCEPEHREKSGG